jgi:hypothetical protein
VRLLHGLRSEPAALEVGELAVVFEELVRPDALHDLDRLAYVLVPLRVDVRRAGGGELLGHPAGADTDVEPAVREVVDGGQLGGEDAGRAERRVDDAHADPDLRRLRGEPGDQRHALEELAPRGHREARGEPLHHAERVLEFLAIGGFRDDDPIEGPDGVEVEILGELGEVLELLDGDVGPEVR